MNKDVSVRDLRNNTARVLRRVEGGEAVRVTVDRRPVAELVPLAQRPTWAPAAGAWGAVRDAQADPALGEELRDLLPQTTDEL